MSDYPLEEMQVGSELNKASCGSRLKLNRPPQSRGQKLKESELARRVRAAFRY